MTKRRIRLAAAMFCCASLALVAGCGYTSATPDSSATPEASSPSPPDGLSDEALAAWTKWQEQGVDDYTYDIAFSCFCGLLPKAHVVVADGVVASVDAPKDEYKMIRSVIKRQPLTADGLFAWIAGAEKTADQVTLKFDEVTGFPTSITLDQVLNASDDEMYVTTKRLET